MSILLSRIFEFNDSKYDFEMPISETMILSDCKSRHTW